LTDNSLFNQDAETAVLSIILQNPNCIYDIISLRHFMFSSLPNRTLFQVMQELSGDGLVPEINLIDQLLKSKNRDTEVGGKDYLNYLIKQTYSLQNLQQFVKIVVDSYKARSLIKILSEHADAPKTSDDIDTKLSSIREALDKLSDSSGGELTSTITDALKELWTDLIDRVKNPGIRGKTTGFDNLDRVTGGCSAGDLYVIAGRPSMGKSATICNMVYRQGLAKIPTMIFSLEMRKGTLMERLVSIDTGISLTDIKLGLLTQEKLNVVSNSIKKLKELPIYIDSNFNAKIEYMVSTIRKYRKLYGVEVVYIDYIQLMSERGADATSELGRISRAFKLLANSLGITIIILSQLNRDVEKRDDKHPMLSDLRQSGNIEEDADIVILLYRPFVYSGSMKEKGIMEWGVSKNRNGPIGTVLADFEDTTNRLTEKKNY
jgi:replicative DNA helicase